MILVSSNSLPVNNIQELLLYAKNNPNKLSYASVGAGTLSMLTMEVFKKSTQSDILHVPYKGSSQAMTDLIGGNVSLMFDGMTSSYVHVKSGKLKALAVASSTRSELASEIPTLKESGNPNLIDFRVEGWTGLFAPPNTPNSITNFLNQEISKVVLDPEFKRRAQAQNFEGYPASTPEQFSLFIKNEFDRWGSVIRPLNLSDK
jgi:tripartite-type tricarboxylate transporter receptor subunit TctC